MKILLQNKLFTPPKISVMLCFCVDILHGILSADMKGSLYILVINIIYYSDDILFSFYVKHIKYYIYVCTIMCISITGLGLKFHIRWY